MTEHFPTMFIDDIFKQCGLFLWLVLYNITKVVYLNAPRFHVSSSFPNIKYCLFAFNFNHKMIMAAARKSGTEKGRFLQPFYVSLAANLKTFIFIPYRSGILPHYQYQKIGTSTRTWSMYIVMGNSVSR